MVKTSYLNKFECIGSKCPNSCCIGWNIDLDEKTYKDYENSEDPELVNYLIKNKDSTPDKYGEIKKDKKERCSFLDKNNLCKVQKKYGEDSLSFTCKSFPRRKVDFGEIAIESGRLSCPEISRLFFEDKNLLELDFINHSKLPLDMVKLIPDKFKFNRYAIDGEKKFNLLLSYFKNKKNKLNQCLEYSIKMIIDENFKFKKISNIDEQIEFSKNFFELFLRKKFNNKLTEEIQKMYSLNFSNYNYSKLKNKFRFCKKETLQRFFFKNPDLYKKFFIHEFFGKVQFLTNDSIDKKQSFNLIFFIATVSKFLLIFKSLNKKNICLNDFTEMVSLLSRYYEGKQTLELEEKLLFDENPYYLYELFI